MIVWELTFSLKTAIANYEMHPFKWDHRINKYYLVNCAGFMLENFVWKPCKWNKNVLFTFGSYVRIMLESSITINAR